MHYIQVIFVVNNVTALRINIRTTNGIIHFISSCFIQVSFDCCIYCLFVPK